MVKSFLIVAVSFLLITVSTSLVFAANPIDIMDINNSGQKADSVYGNWDMSRDGNYLVFTSSSNVLGQTNGKYQLFVRDRVTNTTEMVSIMPDGNPSSTDLYGGFISSDGRYATFTDSVNIYRRDRQTGITDLLISLANHGIQDVSPDARYIVLYVSFGQNINSVLYDSQNQTTETLGVDTNGVMANASLHFDSTKISDDARYAVFVSPATNLVTGDINNTADIFIRDRQTGTTNFLFGNESIGGGPVMSGDGRFVVFGSDMVLVPSDTNNRGDIYLYDRLSQTFDLVNVTTDGQQAMDSTIQPRVSDDGRFVTFQTQSANFSPYYTGKGKNPPTSMGYAVFLRDRQLGVTELIGQNPYCKQPLYSFEAFVSNNGNIVSFRTIEKASDLDFDDNSADLYIRDRMIPFGRLSRSCR